MFLHFSAKKVECAKHQWIQPVGDQPESPQAFESFVVNARWRSTWVRVNISPTLQSSYKPLMHFTMTCTTTHNGGPPGVLTLGTCSLRQIHKLPVEEGGGEENLGACKIEIFFCGPRGRGETFPQRDAWGLILEDLFEGLRSCKSLGLTRGTRGEGLKGGLSALCNAV